MANQVLPRGDGWAMQYRRMLRSRTKLDFPYNSTEDYDDAVYHFFQDAWHLKDWLKTDGDVPTNVQKEVEVFLNKQPVMLATADLANGSKHFMLSAFRNGTTIVEREIAVMVGKEPGVQHTHKLQLGSGAHITALQLADQVISAWELFLTSNKLLPS